MSKVRVVSFELCRQKSCSCSDVPNEHLSIRVSYVEVHYGAATAISYAWGEFNRQKRAIGHFDGQYSPVHMELGEEWDLGEFISAFVSGRVYVSPESRVSPAQQRFWIDQLCHNQDDPAQVRSALAQIPVVYRTFDVAILLPGPQCICWLQNAPSLCNSLPAEAFKGKTLNPQHCMNFWGIYGWTTRLWTRQEMMYANRCRAVWTREEPLPCFGAKMRLLFEQGESYFDWAALTDMPTIPKIAGLWYERCFRTVSTEPRALNVTNKTLSLMGANTMHQVRATLHSWRCHHLCESCLARHSDFTTECWDFLSGCVLYKDKCITGDMASPSSSYTRFLRFFGSLYDITKSTRFVTKSHDYVLSVWVGCPHYKIPENFKSMSPGQLLFDALEQVFRNFGLRLAHHIPAGMFSRNPADDMAGRESFLSRISINSSHDVYDLLHPISLLVSHFDDENHHGSRLLACRPAILNPPNNGIIKPTIVAAACRTGWTPARFLLEVFESIDRYYIQRLATRLTQETDQRSTLLSQSTSDVLRILLKHSSPLGLPNRLLQASGTIKKLLQAGEFHDEAVVEILLSRYFTQEGLECAAYEIACYSLGYDPIAARESRIRLMVKVIPPMIGLRRQPENINDGAGDAIDGPTATKYFLIRRSNAVDGSDNFRGGPIPSAAYEVMAQTGDAQPQPFGVWVPTHRKAFVLGEIQRQGYSVTKKGENYIASNGELEITYRKGDYGFVRRLKRNASDE